MNQYTFDLQISTSHKLACFPVPQTNHYQKISNLEFSTKTQIQEVNPETSVAVFENHHPLTLHFIHTPHEIKQDISSVKILQTKTSPWFSTDEFINAKDKNMQQLAQKWLQEDQAETPNQILTSLYQHTLKYLVYGNPTKYLYPFSAALECKETDCGGFSTFMATLLQTQGIPCRLVVGYLFKRDRFTQLKRQLKFPETFSTITMHAWLEVETESHDWFPIDLSVEWKRLHGTSTRQGGFGFLPADRLVVSFGHNLSFTHQNQEFTFPILQHPEPINASDF